MSVKIKVKLDRIKLDTINEGLVVAKEGEVYEVAEEHISQADIDSGRYVILKKKDEVEEEEEDVEEEVEKEEEEEEKEEEVEEEISPKKKKNKKIKIKRDRG